MVQNGSTNTVMIGDFPVGDAFPPLFMAEIGTYYNQDLDYAFRLLEQIAAAGVKVLKSEILHDAEICLPNTGLQHRYNHAGGSNTEDYRALIDRKILPLAHYEKIIKKCHKLGMIFVASVYDSGGVDFMVKHGGAALKIARNNVNNISLIRYAAKAGLPMIFDMGHVHLDEIFFAVRAAREAGATQIIVNMHPAANPAPATAQHMAMVPALKQLLRCPIGLSCHYKGEEILYAAVAQGTNLIEKGVDLEPDRCEQDTVSALPIEHLKGCVTKLLACYQSTGSIFPIPDDRDLTARSGLVARQNIAAGTELSGENTGYAWPPEGIDVADWDIAMQQIVRQDVEAGQPITWEMLNGTG